MSKITKFAQRIILLKKWWQKLLFWKKYYRSVYEVRVNTYPSYVFVEKAKFYRQKDQKSMTVNHVENDCDFIGNLPSVGGIVIECGIKYWVVFRKKDFRKL